MPRKKQVATEGKSIEELLQEERTANDHEGRKGT